MAHSQWTPVSQHSDDGVRSINLKHGISPHFILISPTITYPHLSSPKRTPGSCLGIKQFLTSPYHMTCETNDFDTKNPHLDLKLQLHHEMYYSLSKNVNGALGISFHFLI